MSSLLDPLHTTLSTRLSGKRLVLLASTGGHLVQLDQISRLINPHPDSLWVTFDKPQSRSMLADRPHQFIDYVAPRDVKGILRARSAFKQILKSGDFEGMISTGAAIALGGLPLGKSFGIPSVYVESVSRFDGPSLSGKLLSRLPSIELRTQHTEWASDKWPFEFSVMDAFVPEESTGPGRVTKIFVTLGTIEPYRFDSLVDAVLRAAPAGAEIVWQLGCTDRQGLPGKVFNEISAEDFARYAMESDVVVTHSGVGSIMNLFAMGCHVAVVPRRKSRGEHVDDHQVQAAKDLARRGLCVVSEAPDLTADDLIRATGMRAKPLGS